MSQAIDALVDVYRQFRDFQQAELRLANQCLAICRRHHSDEPNRTAQEKAAKTLLQALRKGDYEHPRYDQAALHCGVLIECLDHVEGRKKQLEKQLVARGKEAMPEAVKEWIADTRGLAIKNVASVVAEAKGLDQYDTVSKLWKRMGLAVMGDGTRQRKVSGVEALDHGYNPARRATVSTLGDAMIKALGPYKTHYDDRKVYELARVETRMHAHNRAKRYMEKRIIADLWNAWHKQGVKNAQESA